MLAIRSIISMKASSGFLSPKKRRDQRPLRRIWIAKNHNAFLVFLFLTPVFQIRPAEIPIIVYNVVQTGLKTQFGGLKNGFWISTYQVLIESEVRNPEPPPMIKQIKAHIKGRRIGVIQ
tara:strand:- start:19051 stop:19407 length:357 start_codon:yes stop_codon:yes gene_type:complete